MYPKTWLTVILLVATPIVLLLVGFLIGTKVEGAAASKQKLQLQTAHIEQLDKAFANYQTKLEEQRKQNEEVISEYLDEKAEIERKYRELNRSRSLRLPKSICDSGPVPTSSPGESGSTESDAATVALPDTVTEDLRQLARDADEVTAQCRALIEQVNK